MLNRDRRGRRQRPIAKFRGSGPTPIPRRDAQGGHPMGPDDPTRCAPLHRARRRARRVLHPERLNHHGEHLVCTPVCDAALAAHSRLYAGTSCTTLMSTRTPCCSTWQGCRARSIQLHLWPQAPVNLSCAPWRYSSHLTSSCIAHPTEHALVNSSHSLSCTSLLQRCFQSSRSIR